MYYYRKHNGILRHKKEKIYTVFIPDIKGENIYCIYSRHKKEKIYTVFIPDIKRRKCILYLFQT
jgi:predicted RNA-binding protein with TRAM domain